MVDKLAGHRRIRRQDTRRACHAPLFCGWNIVTVWHRRAPRHAQCDRGYGCERRKEKEEKIKASKGHVGGAGKGHAKVHHCQVIR